MSPQGRVVCCSATCYDKHKEGKKHVLTVNHNGELLRQAFYWKANENITDEEVVKRLKDLGLNITSKRFNNQILHNSFYCGYIEHGLLGDEVVKGTQEILIDEDTFNKANEDCYLGAYQHREETEQFSLKRHVKCSECGCYFTGCTVKAKGLDYYKCNTEGCSNNHRADDMHKKYLAVLNSYQTPEEYIPILKDVLKKVFADYDSTKEELLAFLRKRQTELQQSIKVLMFDSVKARFRRQYMMIQSAN